MWEDHKVEDVATPEAFIRDPELVHRFYNARRAYLLDGIESNEALHALTKLSRHWDKRASNEQTFDGKVSLFTQNVDDLHQRAGSHNYPMHGELLKIRVKLAGSYPTAPITPLLKTPALAAIQQVTCGLMQCGLAKCRFIWKR